jgi:hypothetical protein
VLVIDSVDSATENQGPCSRRSGLNAKFFLQRLVQRLKIRVKVGLADIDAVGHAP